MLTTVAVIEDYLGVTLDSAETALYEQIIEAVTAYIEGLCDCSFTDAIYSERVNISCGQFSLRNNVQFLYGLRVGALQVIEVSPPADGVVSVERLPTGGMTVRLIEDLAASTITADSLSLGGVAAAIEADSTWSATMVDNPLASVRALYLADETVQDGDGTIYLQAFTTVATARRQGARLFSSDAAGPGIAVYRGGFAVVPSDLQDLATRMVIKAYSDRNAAAGNTGTLKSETIGDYAYSLMTANEVSASLAGVTVQYQSVLDKYRNFTI